jgi:outer membrane protein TolC
MPHLSFRTAALAVALMPAFGGAASLTIDQALTLAVERSQSARAARADTASAREAARAAGQLPDPTLSIGVDNLPVTGSERFSTTVEPMTMKRIGLSQEWVSHDKRDARQAAADALVRRQSSMAEVAIADTRLQTALAYIDAYFAGEALELYVLDEHHARDELEAAKGRLAASTGNGQEVLALASAQGIAGDGLAEARQARAEAEVALQRWVGTAPADLAPPSIAALPSEAAYVGAAPAVLSAQRDVDVARTDAMAVAAERSPNWTWQASYGQRQGNSDLVSFGVSIPLAVARAERQDRQAAARLALIEKADAQLEEAGRAATAEYRTLAGDVARLAARIERLRSSVIVPARQRTEVAIAGYRSNQVSLASLFEARHAEVDARRKLLGLQRELARAQAQLAYKPLVEGGQP